MKYEEIIKTAKAFVFKHYDKFIDKRLMKSLMADVSKENEPIIRTLLTNQFTTINTTLDRTAPNQKMLLMKVTKEVAQQIMVLRHIVGIQPMTGPVALAFTLQYKTVTDDPTPVFEDLDDEDNKPMVPAFPGPAMRISLDVISSAVQASTRKLGAQFLVTSLQDLKIQHGDVVEAEFIKALGCEIAEEIVTEVVNDIKQLTKGQTPTAIGNVPLKRGQAVHIQLNRGSNEIARKTRRGCGNFVIVSPIGAAQLNTIEGLELAECKEKSSALSLAYVADLVSKDEKRSVIFKVLVSTHLDDDRVIVGYKGKSGEVDTGYTYNPYALVLPMGISVNPHSFEPAMRFATRYGKFMTEKVSDYFQVVEFPPIV